MTNETVITKPKKPAWKTLINILIYIVIVVSIVYGLPKLLTRELHTSYPMAAITSGSMWPVLKVDDLVFIEGVNASDLKVGDIIVYHNYINNTLTIHRIVRFENGTIITKGDANFTEDAPVKPDDVIGRTVNIWGGPLRIPYLGALTISINDLVRKNNTDEIK